MITLQNLYDDYVKDWKLIHKEGEPACYGEWLHNEFAKSLGNNLSDYEKCLLYNEYADFNDRLMWDDIESLNDSDDFLHLYSLINHKKFDVHDNIIIEENLEIVSYTYEDFAKKYWKVSDIVRFINTKGLENIINYVLIVR